MATNQGQGPPRRDHRRREPPALGGRWIAILLAGMLPIALAGCESETADETGAAAPGTQRETDTLELGTEGGPPIVPPMGEDTGTGVDGRDSVLVGEDTAGAEDTIGERDTAADGRVPGRDEGDVERDRDEVEAEEIDTLAVIRPRPSPPEAEPGRVDEKTLEELRTLLDRSLRDLERARALLRQAMQERATTRGRADTSTVAGSG